MRLGVVALLAFLLGTLGSAAAQGRDRLVVLRADPEVEERGEALAKAVAEALVARGEVAVRPPAPVALPDESRALSEAEAAYAGLRPAEALSRLDSLLGRLRDSGGAGLDHPSLVRAFVVRALAARAVSDASLADAAIDQALALEPELTLGEADYPPELRARVEARRISATSARIRLRGLPPGASLTVDGAEAAASSLALLPGMHFVRATHPEYLPWGARVIVPPDALDMVIGVEMESDPTSPLRVPGPPFEPPGAELTRAARARGAALVLVDVARQHGELVAALRVQGHTARAQLGRRADPAALARVLVERVFREESPLSVTPASRPRDRRGLRYGLGISAGVLAIVTVIAVSVAAGRGDAATNWRPVGTVEL